MDFILSGVDGQVLLASTVAVADSAAVANAAEGEVNTEEGMMMDPMAGAQTKDPILSSWIFVIGISVLVLAASVALGIFLAKRKIKKGIELYED